jgi:hypothetical protein
MTEIQSAVGRVQLRKLSGWVAARRRNAAILHEAFEKIPGLRTTAPGVNNAHAYYKYYAFVRQERLRAGWSRDRIMETIASRGIPCTAGSCSEVYLERAFPEEMRPPKRLPVAQELGETSLMFQVHPTLTEQNMRYVAESACEIVREATE